jgi:flagellar biosynthetic protein FlhB
MSQGGDDDKTEDPTPHRLNEARKRGEVAKSQELTGWLVMAAFAVALAVTGAAVAEAMAAVTGASIRLSGAHPVVGVDLYAWLVAMVAPVGQALLPIAMAVIVIAVVGNLAQAGAVVTTEPLSPKFDRMNPAQALQRIFSIQTVYEFGKLACKLGVLGALVWWAWLQLPGVVESIALGDPRRIGSVLAEAFATASLLVLLPLGLMAVVDFAFVRYRHIQKLRMSRRDLKDEHKQHEGDPEIRAKRKQMLRDLLKRSKSAGGASGADVVITNPTHFAVALRYRPREMRAPTIVAKGAGHFAAKIRRECAAAGVPLISRPELARRMFRECEVGQPISGSLYRELAPIYRWLMARPGQRILT